MATSVGPNGETPFFNGRDVPHPVLDLDPAVAAEVDLEASRWAEILALVELLTPDERIGPGYFRDPDWTVKDLLAHLGWWHAEARSELLKIALFRLRELASQMEALSSQAKTDGVRDTLRGLTEMVREQERQIATLASE